MGHGRTTQDRVVAVVTENAASLLRIARMHSLCADDAQDAYQRALEIYLERVEEVDEATAGAWLRTVCKHEAIRLRDQRLRILPAHEVRFDLRLGGPQADPEARAEALERTARAAEALRECKRDEVTAMLLRADGSTYAEIGEVTGWTYTKVNRCLAEGRARFLARFAALESGSACDAWAPVLSAIVDGEATPDDFARVRPHLRNCQACRATLKALYETEPAIGALVPAGLLVAASAGTTPAGPAVEQVHGIVARAYEAVATGLGDRLARLHAVLEAVTSTKAAAVVASTAAVAAGGAAAVDRAQPAARAADVAHVAGVPHVVAPVDAVVARRARRRPAVPSAARAVASSAPAATLRARRPASAPAAPTEPAVTAAAPRRVRAPRRPAPTRPVSRHEFAFETAPEPTPVPTSNPVPRGETVTARTKGGDTRVIGAAKPTPTTESTEFGFEG